jgi:hypothetical protein
MEIKNWFYLAMLGILVAGLVLGGLYLWTDNRVSKLEQELGQKETVLQEQVENNRILNEQVERSSEKVRIQLEESERIIAERNSHIEELEQDNTRKNSTIAHLRDHIGVIDNQPLPELPEGDQELATLVMDTLQEDFPDDDFAVLPVSDGFLFSRETVEAVQNSLAEKDKLEEKSRIQAQIMQAQEDTIGNFELIVADYKRIAAEQTTSIELLSKADADKALLIDGLKQQIITHTEIEDNLKSQITHHKRWRTIEKGISVAAVAATAVVVYKLK